MWLGELITITSVSGTDTYLIANAGSSEAGAFLAAMILDREVDEWAADMIAPRREVWWQHQGHGATEGTAKVTLM